ncbi:MAG: 4-hydroxythreonine-4-phosphate dehydrogenase PdxA [Alloprevotella sp.]
MPAEKIKVGITQGDTNGVGYELICKVFSEAGMFELCTPVVFGHLKVANYHKKGLGYNLSFHVISSAADAVADRLNFVNCSDEEIKVEFGQPGKDAGVAAFAALEKATEALHNGEIDVLVTLPINKANIQSEQFHFPGHTEYLQSRFLALQGIEKQEETPAVATVETESGEETEVKAETIALENQPLMILLNSQMRIALASTHLPISEVASAVTPENLELKLRLFHQSLRRDFGLSNPRIAVLALNPHAGDHGVLGSEEEQVIRPVIEKMTDCGITCMGSFAADGFFGAGMYRHFDGVLAMYHDQGLAAFKALSFDDGVNFTAGLPFVRTSPDHGTAYDIAGKNQALPDSFRHAIYTALDVWRARRAFDEAHRNPLPKLYQERKER